MKFKADVMVCFSLLKEAMGAHNPSLSKELMGVTRLEDKKAEYWEIGRFDFIPPLWQVGDQAHTAFCSA